MSGVDTEGAAVDGGKEPPVERRPAVDTEVSPLPELADREFRSPVMEYPAQFPLETVADVLMF
jgi:hypothetical protein